VPVAPGVHWIGAFDPDLRNFDIILRTANGTSYNAYAVRGSAGVAVIDTVKANFADASSTAWSRLPTTTRSPPSSSTTSNPTIPARCRNCCAARRGDALRLAPGAADAQGPVRSGRIRGPHQESAPATRPTSADRRLEFFNTPYLHWPDTQCTWLEDEGILFSGDFLGCHYCDTRLFNDAVGDFRFSFDYYYAHIMRPFRAMCAPRWT
jgi:hypothetical protein